MKTLIYEDTERKITVYRNHGHYTIYVNNIFWGTADSMREVFEELEEINGR